MKSTFYLDRYIKAEEGDEFVFDEMKNVLDRIPSLGYKHVKIPEFEWHDLGDTIHIRRQFIKPANMMFKHRIELAHRIDSEQFENKTFGIKDYFLVNFIYDGHNFWFIDFDGFGFGTPEERRVKFDRNFGDYLRQYRDKV